MPGKYTGQYRIIPAAVDVNFSAGGIDSGGVMFRTSGGAFSNLPMGTAVGQVLKNTGSGYPVWGKVRNIDIGQTNAKVSSNALLGTAIILRLSGAGSTYRIGLPSGDDGGGTRVMQIIDSAATTMVVSAISGDTINGATTLTANGQWATVQITPYSGGWIEL